MNIFACTYFSYEGGTRLQMVEAETKEQAHAKEVNFLMRRVFNVTESLAHLPKGRL